jgi:hypothetical protein
MQVLLLVPQLIRKHDWDFIDDWIEPPASATGESTFDDEVALAGELVELQWIVLVDWASQYVKEVTAHI